MKNALTIDLEDYFHVTAFADHVDISQWDSYSSRVQLSCARVLELLESHSCRATFFVLGWLAMKHPRLIRQIADAGHEIACHSFQHRLVYELTPTEFREDTRRAQGLLEDASGRRVVGYRAPSFSINGNLSWAFEILAELGFHYDSSIFPVKHPNYGVVDAPRSPYHIQTGHGPIVEFPMTALQLGARRSPFGGGAYLRLLPYCYTRWGIRYLNENEGRSVCLYLHPWELDPDQPRISGSFTSRVRQYVGIGGTLRKLQKLLRDFEFCPLEMLVSQWVSQKGISSSRPCTLA